MRINEVDPRNYDSDIDYYNALNARPKRHPVGEPRLSPAQQDAEDEDAISQQRQAAAAKARKERETAWDDKQEGAAPNGQQYNSVYTINAPSKASADSEAYSFKDYHWGAKKAVDQEYKDLGDGRVELKLYVVDNHKYGLWRPWKDSPVYKEGAESVTEGGFKNMYAEFSGYGNYMQGRAVNVFNKFGLEIVSKEYSEDDDIQTYVVKGDRWSIEKAGKFLERNPDEYGGYHFVKQGVDEMDSQGYRGSRDSAEDDAGKKEYSGKVTKPSDVVKQGTKALDNAFNHKEDDWSADFERRMKKGVAEGVFGIDSRTKGAIQNVVSQLSDIPGMWDHQGQTFTPHGVEQLKSLLKNNEQHIDYALNLTADDFDEGVEEKAKNPYAIGMAQAMKSTGDEPPLDKATIRKAHEIAKRIMQQD